MSWTFSVALRGQLRPAMRAEVRAGIAAVNNVVARAGKAGRKDVQAQLRRAKLGPGMPKMVRHAFRPTRTLDGAPLSSVFSKPFTRRNNEPADVLGALESAGIIHPHKGMLEIPTRLAIQRGRPRPKDWPPEETVRIPPRGGARGRIVYKRAPRFVLFWIVPSARLLRRITLDTAVAAGEHELEKLAEDWERRVVALERRF